MKKIPITLGIDFGTRRVGLAISRSKLVEPLITLEMNDDFWQKLEEIVKEQQVAQVVVGLSEKKSAQFARKMGQKIETNLGLTVYYADETLSTYEARNRLSEAGRRLGPKDPVDHFAAAIILENWIDVDHT